MNTAPVITMTRVYDPLDHTNQDTIKYEFRPGNYTLAELVADATPKLPETTAQIIRYAASINGNEISPLDWADTYVLPGQDITIMPVLHGGGGGGGKDPLRTLLTIAVVVATIYYAPMIGLEIAGALNTAYAIPYATALASAGIMMVGSMIVNAIAPPSRPQTPALNGAQSLEQSNSYSWSPVTTQQQGVAVPVPYGLCKLRGNVISAYRESVGKDQYVNMLVALGKGPLGWIGEMKLNGQLLENYKNVTVESRLGRLNQAVLPGFGDTKTEYAMSMKVLNGAPVVYTTIGNGFNAIEIEVTFPQGLFYYTDQGALSSNSVNYRVEVQEEGTSTWKILTYQPYSYTQTTYNNRWSRGQWYWYFGGWTEVEAGSNDPYAHSEGEWGGYAVNGYGTQWRWISAASYQTVSGTYDYATASDAKTQPIRITHSVPATQGKKYTVRVTNLSADKTDSRYGDDLYLSAVREVMYDDFVYPEIALVSLRALATDQLSGSLNFECRTTGKLVRVYRGGQWYTEVSRNPAWVCWDILTQPIFNDDNTVAVYQGFDPSKLDLVKWVEWADYCDDLVPDGKGGQEKRIEWCGQFDAAQNLWDAALSVARLGRATPYWRGTKLTLAIDKPATATKLISVGNIGLDSFEETFLNMEGRASRIEADFVSLDNDLERDKFTVVNTSAPADWGSATAYVQGEIRPSGVWRHMMFQLARTLTTIRTASVQMNVSAISFTLGDVVDTQHDVPRWGDGGRLVSGATTQVVLDRQVTMEVGKTYSVRITSEGGEYQTRQVVTQVGSTDTLIPVTPFATAPAQYDVWAFEEYTKNIKPMRVIGLERLDDLRYKVHLEEYNASIYDVDLGLPAVPTRNYSPSPAAVSVTGLALSERLLMVRGVITTSVMVTWDPPTLSSTTREVAVWAGIQGAPKTKLAVVSAEVGSYEFEVLDGETWEVQVQAGNGLLFEPLTVSPKKSITVIGKLALPADVTDMWASPTTFGGLQLSWTPVPDLDLLHYEIRYSPLTTAANWDSSVYLTKAYTTTATIPAALDGTYLVKAIDTGLRESTNAAAVVTTIPSLITFNAVEAVDDGPTWPGVKEGLYQLGDKLYLDAAGAWDDIADFDALGSVDTYGGILAEGFYYAAEVVSLSSVQTCRCSLASIDFVGVNGEANWDSITNFDALDYIDSAPGVNVQPQISLSDDNVVWSAWQPFVSGDYTAKHFKFRLRATSSISTNYAELRQFGVVVDMPDRSNERGQNVAVAALGTPITFTQPFIVPPIVRGTVRDAQSGDTVNITNITTTGATLQVLNGGSGAARTMDWQAVGY